MVPSSRIMVYIPYYAVIILNYARIFSYGTISRVMSQSIPTGYIPPPGNPGENFFERANPGHPGKFFCLIPCPGAKNDGRIPGGGAKFPKLEETAP